MSLWVRSAWMHPELPKPFSSYSARFLVMAAQTI